MDLGSINFASNDRLREVMARTTALPGQVEAAAELNIAARLRALKAGLLLMACVSLLTMLPASRLPDDRPRGFRPARRGSPRMTRLRPGGARPRHAGEAGPRHHAAHFVRKSHAALPSAFAFLLENDSLSGRYRYHEICTRIAGDAASGDRRPAITATACG
ncbi:hypothetical protein [Roseicella aerolata]|uniref:Uncharacterized protein n=1 Tax=Roseicella aerolata TaxID=2883479 RepID=A0A9X1LDH3_9PROT|nr:hypothetical protein [Roseicella aerolata]MCB4824797.1 hypothetical protein [Roseicella aerolata]